MGLSLEGRREGRATGIGEEVHQDLLVEMGSRVCEEELRKKKALMAAGSINVLDQLTKMPACYTIPY